MGERVPRPATDLDGGHPVDNRLFQGAQRDIGGKQNRSQSIKEEAGDRLFLKVKRFVSIRCDIIAFGTCRAAIRAPHFHCLIRSLPQFSAD